MPPARRGPALTRARFALGILLLALLAVVFRCVAPWSLVFPAPARVMLVDTDSYFHLRHARHAMQHFPHIFRNDDAWGYPELEQNEGAGLFDVATGGLALLASGGDTRDELTLERTCAAMPLLCVVAVILLLAYGARRLVGQPLALWVVAAFIAYPGLSISVTQLGYCDHHVAEMLCTLAVVFALTRLLEECARPEVTPGRAWAWSWAMALPLVLFLFTWVGAPLWIPLLTLGGMAVIALDVARGGPEDAVYQARVRALGRYALAALVSVAVLTWCRPELTMAFMAQLAAMCALAGLALYAWLHVPAARFLTRRGHGPCAVAAAGVILPLVIVFAGLSSVSTGRSLIHYLLTPKTGLVSEHKPISAWLLWLVWGLPALPALAALPLIVRRARADAAAAPRVVPVVCGLGIATLWLLSRDYGYQTAAFVPLLAGLAFDELGQMAPRWRTRAGVLLPALLAVPFLPVDWVEHPWMKPANVAALQEVDPGWLEAASWLRDKTPANGLPQLDRPEGTPAPATTYGVAARWDRGNLLVSKALRRSVWARFPSDRCAAWYVETDEDDALRLLCPTCKPDESVRYVVVDAHGVSKKFVALALMAGRPLTAYRASAAVVELDGRRYGPASYGRPWRNAVSVKLYYMDGDDLTHHRLVFESADRSSHYFLVSENPADVVRMSVPASQAPLEPGQVGRVPGGIAHDVSEHASAKVFEVVAGAMVEGVAGPGAPVELLVALQAVNTGRKFAQVRRFRAGPDGRWRQRVPYASRTAPDALVRGLMPYRVRWLDAKGVEMTKNLDVTDEDVVEGRRVALP